MAGLCILTPDPEYEERVTRDCAAFRAILGKGLSFRPWNGAGDLARFDLVMPLLAWGYHKQAARWYAQLDAWEAQGIRLANRAALLRWNTDKDYLVDLAAQGVAVVPTLECHRFCRDSLAQARKRLNAERLVVKPAISGGSDRTYLLGPDDALPADTLEREMLVQPEMAAIATEGEFSLLWFDGVFSHALLKTPKSGDFRVQEQFGGIDRAVAPEPAMIALSEAVLATLAEVPLYARIDMVRDGGAFLLMELEAIEPALFLQHAPDGGAAFARAVQARR